MFFLTIGIPTWNRATPLEHTLNCLLSEITRKKIKMVEILVCDNASSDHTPLICHAIEKEHAFFNYVRCDHNYGANENLKKIFHFARGTYVWLLGDDDAPTPMLNQLLSDLLHLSPDLAIATSIREETQQKTSLHEIKYATLCNKTILKKTDLMLLAGRISHLIFKKEAIQPALKQADALLKGKKTAWLHLMWIILMIQNQNDKILLLPYSTCILLERHWHNLLFTGKELLDIYLKEYYACIALLKPQLNRSLYNACYYRHILPQIQMHLKCFIYGTYLNTYQEMLQHSLQLLKNQPGLINKGLQCFFLVLPCCLPIVLRRTFLEAISHCLRKGNKLSTLIKQLHHSQQSLVNQHDLSKRLFNEEES